MVKINQHKLDKALESLDFKARYVNSDYYYKKLFLVQKIAKNLLEQLREK